MEQRDVEAVIAALIYSEPRVTLHPGVKETHERALQVMAAELTRIMNEASFECWL